MKKRFTLIELPVVIAIIAILASMLLPALNKARERGQAIHCMSTYSNLGKVLQMYVADFDGLIPPGQCGGLIWYKGGPLTNYIAEIEKNWNAVVGGKNGNTLSKFICPSYHSDEALFYTVGYNGYLKHYYINFLLIIFLKKEKSGGSIQARFENLQHMESLLKPAARIVI